MGFIADAVGSVVGGAADKMTQKNNYNALAPEITKQNFSNDIDYHRAQENSANLQQQGLADTLAQQMNGQGPNAALAQYQQNVNQNAAQGAGMIASQKGISPALAARLIAQQTGAANQNAAGQAATTQAQQQATATGMLQQQQANMANQALQGQSIFQGAQANQNSAINGGTLGAEQINAGVAAGNADNTNKASMGILNGIGSIASSGIGSGAKVAGKAMGGEVQPLSHHLMMNGGRVPGVAPVPGNHPANDIVMTPLSPGEIVIPRTEAHDPEKAMAFLEHITNQKSSGYGDVLKKKKALAEAK